MGDKPVAASAASQGGVVRPRKGIRMRISRESLAIFVIGGLDLALTLCLWGHNRAREANPLMAYFLAHGPGALAGAKTAMLVCPLAVLEWCRTRNPRFTRCGMRIAIAAYVLILGGGLLAQPVVGKTWQRVTDPSVLVYPPLTPAPAEPAAADITGPL